MRPVKLLVVEDEALVAMHLENCLKALGYEVRSASSGEEALELAQAWWPQLALMDIHLAGVIDGIEAADELRRRFHVPSVFLTAYADEQTIQRAKKAEPVGYLVKPFRERELHATIEVALRRSLIERRLREREQWHHALLDTLRDPVILTDATGRVSTLNRAAEKMTGRTTSQACGRPLADLFPMLEAGRLARLKEGLRRAIREGAAVDLSADPVWISPGSGESYSAEAALPMLDEAGALNGAVLLFRDRTDGARAPESGGATAAAEQGASPALAVDPQTGLPGRAEAERVIAQVHRQGSRAFVGVFVIEHFKTILQRYGFTAAEEVILFFSVHLAQGLATGAQLFRWTGPVFVAVAERLDSVERVRREMAGLAAVKLEKVLQLKTRTALVVVSAAWEVYPIYSSASVEHLVRQIDAFAAAHCS